MMDLNRNWTDYEYVAFDTETSGAYPLGSDIVEFGAVRWKNGKVIDEYQTLIKPTHLIPEAIIKIHGITNEMVADAPSMQDKIQEIRNFFQGAVLMAHHAPFDMGFIMAAFEKYKILPPEEPVICTSLLARKKITGSENHKLQTLIKFLNLHQGEAHRAKDDAEACLHVGIHCMNLMGPHAKLSDVLKVVWKDLRWTNYSLMQSNSDFVKLITEALQSKKDIDMIYLGGSLGNKTRRVTPIGIVRNPDGDFLFAKCHVDGSEKRFYLNKVKDLSIVHS